MAKTFKRIAALATVIALVVCFAVSASAIEVKTTTQYVTDSNETKVNVTVDVSDTTAEYVTYYATKSGVVYVDQVAVENGAAQIKYQTDAANLKGSVKVGYTGGADALDRAIDANTISYKGGSKLIPTAATTATIVFDYAPAEGKTVDTITVSGNAAIEGEPEYISSEGKISVALKNITGDAEIKVTEKDAVTFDATAELIDAAAFKVVEGALGDDEANMAKVGDRKITVIGKALNADEYGIVVSKAELTDGYADKTALEAAGAKFYEALGNVAEGDNKGLFAVQIIDEGENDAEATIQTGVVYNVAIYVKDGSQYKLDAGMTVKAE